MNKLKTTLTSALMLLAINFSNTTSAENISTWQLSPDGFGPIKIGMTLKQASTASDKEFTNDKPDPTYENEGCFNSLFKDKNLKDVTLMVSDKKIVRIDVTSPEFSTTKGAHVGDTEKQVISLYGKMQIQPHHYDPKGKYLTYKQSKNRAIRFETNDKQQVTVMYAGRYQEVQYVEGCL